MAIDLRIGVRIRAPRATVFPLLLTPHHLARWFCNFAQVEPTVGGRFRFGGDYAIAAADPPGWSCEILSGEALAAVAFRWPLPQGDTRVDWRAEDAAEGCVLRVAHTGLPGEDTTCGMFLDAWRICLGNLKAIAEGRSDSLRPDSSPPMEPTKLDVLIDVPPRRVFEALVEPERLQRWAGDSSPSIVDPRVGGRYGMGGGGAPGTILAWEPATTLTVAWPPGGPAQRFTITLEEKSGGRCGLYSRHAGLSLDNPDALLRFRSRWTDCLVGLKNYLEAGETGFTEPRDAEIAGGSGSVP